MTNVLSDSLNVDLQQDYYSFAASIQGLSAMETNISSQLSGFAETTHSYAKAMSEMVTSKKGSWQLWTKSLLNRITMKIYCF